MQVVKLRILKNSSDPRSTFVHQHTLDKETKSLSNRFAPALSLESFFALENEAPPLAPHRGLGYNKRHMKKDKLTAYKYFANLENQERIAHLN